MHLIRSLVSFLLLPFNVTIVVPLLILSFCSDFVWSSSGFFGVIEKVGGFALLFAGAWLFGFTVLQFYHQKDGTLAPWDPISCLIETGPYSIMRNPMITGVIAILIGESLIYHNYLILAWAIGFAGVNHVYLILIEEKQLLLRYGQAYAEYQRRVPRWLPNFF